MLVAALRGDLIRAQIILLMVTAAARLVVGKPRTEVAVAALVVTMGHSALAALHIPLGAALVAQVGL